MLANTQFVENRVYDDDETAEAEEEAARQAEAEAKAAADADPAQVLARWQAAVTCGMGALKFKFNADDGPADTGEDDIYNSRSLPFVIGTAAWLESDDAGLGTFNDEDDYVRETEHGGEGFGGIGGDG